MAERKLRPKAILIRASEPEIERWTAQAGAAGCTKLATWFRALADAGGEKESEQRVSRTKGPGKSVHKGAPGVAAAQPATNPACARCADVASHHPRCLCACHGEGGGAAAPNS